MVPAAVNVNVALPPAVLLIAFVTVILPACAPAAPVVIVTLVPPFKEVLIVATSTVAVFAVGEDYAGEERAERGADAEGRGEDGGAQGDGAGSEELKDRHESSFTATHAPWWCKGRAGSNPAELHAGLVAHIRAGRAIRQPFRRVSRF